jgi:tRNA U54 and U55 pseudouridine synthase Pus10
VVRDREAASLLGGSVTEAYLLGAIYGLTHSRIRQQSFLRLKHPRPRRVQMH